MTAANQTRIARIEDAIHTEMARWRVPGLAIGVLDGHGVETAAFGIANFETAVAATPETLFQIGSISKIFTTTLAMALVDNGELQLDRPVIDYVPDLPLADDCARRTVTLRHLLTHMGGFFGDRFDHHGRGDDALARTIAAFGDLTQQTAPGELWTYCNAGFDLVGRIIEVVTGQVFETLMRERVFAPLELDRVTYFADEAILHAVAVGHHSTSDGGVTVASPWPIARNSNPAGGVSVNVGELLRFAQMHMQDGELDGVRVISPASARSMREHQVDAEPFTAWGLGWRRRVIDGETIIEHNGATNGFTARLTTIPARRFAIAILTNHNLGGAAHGKVSGVALERLHGIREPERPHVVLSPERLQQFAGTYRHRLADYTLTPDGDGFEVTRVNRNPFSGETRPGEPSRLSPVGERIFIAAGGGLDGSFGDVILNADGSVRFFRFGGRLGYPVAAGDTQPK